MLTFVLNCNKPYLTDLKKEGVLNAIEQPVIFVLKGSGDAFVKQGREER